PVNGWSASASYTIATPRVTKISSDYSGGLKVGDALVRRPTHTGNGTLTYSAPTAGSLSVMASYIGKRPDLDFTQFPSPVVTLPSYVKLDVAASRVIFHTGSGKGSISVTGRVDNVLDKKYEDVLNFASPRRSFMVGARLTGSL
ncbi:MAG TPA: hypothetical protein VFC35_06630, partial [Gemmatimonadaceae bacterium]|nr:hypothetical protein [Gemmatimonadaceae bacterium]